MTLQAVIYARLSSSREACISVAQQLERGRAYACAQGWTVVGEFVDEGVSGAKVAAADRPGWRLLMASPGDFDRVVILKIDRLARNVADFLATAKAVEVRGAQLAAVAEQLDMGTPQGRAFATILAAFAELEAEHMKARQQAARDALIKAGRRPGGPTPWGFVNTLNPDGPGFVLRPDPELAPVLLDLVRRAISGASLYSLAKHLDAIGIAPRARAHRTRAGWNPDTVEIILRSPALAGMTTYTPGRRGHCKTQSGQSAVPVIAPDVLRDGRGVPIADPECALISENERLLLLTALDGRLKGRRHNRVRPHLLRSLLTCGTCGSVLHRNFGNGARGFRCASNVCPTQVSVIRENLERHVEATFLNTFGNTTRVYWVPSREIEVPRIACLDEAIAETTDLLRDPSAERSVLLDRLDELHNLRAEATDASSLEKQMVLDEVTVAHAWASAAAAWDEQLDRTISVEADAAVERRNAILRDYITVIRVFVRGAALEGTTPCSCAGCHRGLWRRVLIDWRLS